MNYTDIKFALSYSMRLLADETKPGIFDGSGAAAVWTNIVDATSEPENLVGAPT